MKSKKLHYLLLILTFASLLAAAACASGGQSDFRSGDKVVIAEGEVIDDDLIITANQLQIDGTIKGDLIAMGANITLGPTGVIEEDLMAAGQSVAILGQVLDDARIAGGVLQLGEQAIVGDDLVSAGYSLETKPASQVDGSAIFGGYQALLAGDIQEDLKASAAGLELLGTVGGNAELSVGSPDQGAPQFNPFTFMPNTPPIPKVEPGFQIGEDAQVAGSLQVETTQPVEVPTGAVQGDVTQTKPATVTVETPEKSPTASVNTWARKLGSSFLSLVIVGLLLAWLFPALTTKSAVQLKAKPWHSLGTGCLTVIGFALAFLIIPLVLILAGVVLSLISLGGLVNLCFAIGGFVMSLLGLAFVFAVLFASKLVISLVLGQLIFKAFKSPAAEGRVWPLVVGLVIFTILASMPWIGWLFNLAAILFGLGALVLWMLALRKPPAVTAPAVAEPTAEM